MQCVMDTIPTSAMEPRGGGVTSEPSEFPILGGTTRSTFSRSQSKPLRSSSGSSHLRETPLVLSNKTPRWHEQLRCWCLNFQGRVTVASVKNFQLVAAEASSSGGGGSGSGSSPERQNERIILQFGKVGKDMFTMDYGYPISAFQAFAICLSSFETRIACE